MARIIRNDGIGRELSTRFDLDVTGPYEPLTIPPSVQLTHPVDDLLLQLKMLQGSATSTLLQTIWTVPQGERWHILGVSTYRAQAADVTTFLLDLDGNDYVAAFNTGQYCVVNFPQKTVLPAGWQIDQYALPGVSGAIRNTLLYQMETVV